MNSKKVQSMISRKKIRQIKGIRKGKIFEYFKGYIGPFLYLIVFAFLQFYTDSDRNYIFIRTFGLVIFDLLAYIVYCIFDICQSERYMKNDYLKNKKLSESDIVPLLDKDIGKYKAVAFIKAVIFLLFFVILQIYMEHVKTYMTLKSAFDYVMFFVSIIFFDIFWDGGYKEFRNNLQQIKKITEKDNCIQRLLFYILLVLVAIYQISCFVLKILKLISIFKL